ncbi:MAG: hypothetical protein ABW203_00060 [Novosphingobium sp.]
MTAAKGRRRGQPLAMLVLILVGWSAMRAALWDDPFAGSPAIAQPAGPRRFATARFPAPMHDRSGKALPRRSGLIALFPGSTGRVPPRAIAAEPGRGALAPLAPPATAPAALPLGWTERPMLPAALAQSPPSPGAGAPPAPFAPAAAPGGSEPRRWSGDGWLLWRRGSSRSIAAAGLATYGGSQAGAVLRYALAGGGHVPVAYLRLTSALAVDESEAAAGLSARPLAALPVRLLAEGRVFRSGGATRLRPAASLVSEVVPQKLPLGGEAELYAQAGYVGGREATPFIDAQLTADRSLLKAGRIDLRLGAGIWAGGQEGASRLDIGPRASVRLPLGPAAGSRLALDWRFRVAGDAVPASGPAVTLSAGF